MEAGSEDELKIVQDFVYRKSRERRLKDRLHAIWFVFFGHIQLHVHKFLVFRYCVPLDCARPSLELKYFGDVCPDKSGTSKHSFMNRN
jgi:hypothetical protein